MKAVKGIVIILIAWVQATGTVAADAIDDFVNSQLEPKKVPGIALLVMHKGAVVKQQGYGYADVEFRVPVTADTLFQSGSLGKQFTAAGILLLAQEGKLNLDDRLTMHYPDAPAAWHRISIRHLLTHTSGMKDAGPDDVDLRKDYTDDELLGVLKKLPIEFEPGTQWSYSNSGYVLLGLLTTKLAGKHWGEFQAERLFKPLGMTTTRMISDREVIPNRASGYQLDKGEILVNQDWVSPTFNSTADGALYFSVRDLAAWEKALEARSFMSAQSFKDWWTPVTLNDARRYPYGFGWFLAEQRGQPVIEHTGSWQGFTSVIARYPEQQLAVAVLTNAAQANPATIARTVAGLVEPTLALRAPTASVTGAAAKQAERLRGVLEAWGTYRTVPAMSPALAATATGSAGEAHHRAGVAEELRGASSFKVLGSDRLTKPALDLIGDGSVSAVDAVLETEKEPILIRFRLDSRDRVVGFDVQ
jgi:CubicO group peptidase (beta-lactamase class C family)